MRSPASSTSTARSSRRCCVAGAVRRRRVARAADAADRAAAPARERTTTEAAALARSERLSAARRRAARARARRLGTVWPAEDVDLGDVVAGRVELWEPLAARARRPARRRGSGGAVVARRHELGSSRCSTTCSRTRSTRRRAGATITRRRARAESSTSSTRGPGMTADQRARAFDRFWRAGQGAGLGPRSCDRTPAGRGGRGRDRAAPGADARHRRRGALPGGPRVVGGPAPSSGPGPMLGPGGDDDPVARGFHRRGPGPTGRARVRGPGPNGSTPVSSRCPGVGAALAKRLRALGLETVRDLLLHRPRRYESAVDEVAISQLWGDDEVAIAGEVVDVRTRRLGGRRSIVTARGQGLERVDRRVVVQPALARRQADARDAACGCAASSGATAST